MEKQIRKPRTYKIADKPYNKAKKRAKGKLATMIEAIVTSYGNGDVMYISDLAEDEAFKECAKNREEFKKIMNPKSK